MKIEFKNRYGDMICFERIDTNYIKMTGYNPGSLRYAWGERFFKSVDPSGGPVITTGDNMKYYFDVEEDMYVNDISVNNGHILLTVDATNKSEDQNPLNKR